MLHTKIKPFISGLIIGGLLTTTTVAIANNPIDIFLNGQKINGANAMIIEDQTYVPLRVIGENLGVNVEWDNVNKKVDIIKNNNLILEEKNNHEVFIEDENYDNLDIYIYNKIPYFETKDFIKIAKERGLYVDYKNDNEFKIEGINYSKNSILINGLSYYSIELLPIYYKLKENSLYIYWRYNR